jgi:hypothetical protein
VVRKILEIEVMNDQALTLIKDLEALDLIEIRKDFTSEDKPADIRSYKGKMKQQPLLIVEEQLQELRNGWE